MTSSQSHPQYSKGGVVVIGILFIFMAGVLLITLGGIQGAWFTWSSSHSFGSAAVLLFLLIAAGCLSIAISAILWGIIKPLFAGK